MVVAHLQQGSDSLRRSRKLICRAAVTDKSARGGEQSLNEPLLIGVLHLEDGCIERATSSAHAIMIRAKCGLKNSGIAFLHALSQWIIVFLPPDAEAVVINIGPVSFGGPSNRIVGVKCASAFGLRKGVSVAGNGTGDPLVAFFPGVTDIPVHGVNHHSVEACVHPEMNDLFRLTRPFVVDPVVLR